MMISSCLVDPPKIKHLHPNYAKRLKNNVSSSMTLMAKKTLDQQKEDFSLPIPPIPIRAFLPTPQPSFFLQLKKMKTNDLHFSLKQRKFDLQEIEEEPEEVNTDEITQYGKTKRKFDNLQCHSVESQTLPSKIEKDLITINSASKATLKKPFTFPLLNPKKKITKIIEGDRFIPSPQIRSNSEFTTLKLENTFNDDSTKNNFKKSLVRAATGLNGNNTSLLGLNALPAEDKTLEPVHVKDSDAIKKFNRHPELSLVTALDAPNLSDNFYDNILSISNNNILAVALGNEIYLKELRDNSATIKLDRSQLLSLDRPTSLLWLVRGKGELLAIGTGDGYFEIWNTSVPNGKLLFLERIGYRRIASIAQLDHETLAVGSRDLIAVIKLKQSFTKFSVSTIKRQSETCKLASSPDGKYLASGENGNRVRIWKNSTKLELLHSFRSHTAAIKAISWNPCFTQEGLLATGGGTGDRTIKLWNAITGEELFSVDTKEQLTGLHWLSDGKYLISTHGFPTSSIRLWRFSKKEGQYKLDNISVKLENQLTRILFTSLAADNNLFVTAGGETISIWKIKGQSKNKAAAEREPFAQTIR